MRRKYEKPQVTEVRLTSDEVVLRGCKLLELDQGPGYPQGVACGFAINAPCSNYPPSGMS